MIEARLGVPPDARNLHASAVVLGDRGVLITGPSGSGKTLLALELVERWRGRGALARLVADDQLFVAPRAGRLLAWTPASTAGSAEARFDGPFRLAHEGACVVDLVVDLVPADAAPRFQQGARRDVCGVMVTYREVPRHAAVAACHVVQAVLAG
jgi:serine kinase of HPr protein (carbohydrate metabolism regulator)